MQQVTQLTNHEETDVKNSLVTTVKSESSSDRDAGFYSGEDTDFEVQYHSPTTTETSRDSVDTKESVDNRRNKRKFDKANKFRDDESDVKRIKLEPSANVKTEPGAEDECDDNLSDRITSPLSIKNEIDSEISSTVKSEPWHNVVVVGRPRSPFRPWNVHQKEAAEAEIATVVLPAKIPSGYLPPLATSPYQEEPLALVVEKRRNRDEDDNDNPYKCRSVTPRSVEFRPREVETDEQVQDLRVGRCPQEVVRINPSTGFCNGARQFQPDGMDSSHNRYPSSSSTTSSSEGKRKSSHCSNSGHQHQRNYKNMTRERRIEANARERTRVHTISAAFETLRKCVPAYANNQKLSKLSVLRIACSYIMTLSRIAGYDYSVDQSAPSVAECVDSVSNTIQMEGKTRKK